TTGVPASVSATFSEAMDPVLINTNEIYLRTHNTSTTVPTTLTISPDYMTVTLTPITPLAESTIYDIYYYPNPWWLTDIAGNNSTTNYGILSTFTTGTTAAVAGVCGTANGQTFSAPPTANLCSTGTASAVNNAGGASGFTWSCGGQYGGAAASCSATVTPAGACYPQSSLPAGSLISWWKGDGDATDHMGNNNGTQENGAGFAVGAVNDAFSFNGDNQYVLIGEPVPADLQIQNAITLSAWIYPTAYPTTNGTSSGSQTWGMIMGSENNPADGAAFFLSGYPNVITDVPIGAIDFDLGDGTNWHEALTTTQVPLNQWTLVTVAATANHPMQIYFNGVAQPTVNNGTSQWTGTVAYNSGEWFAIGQDSANNYPFNGLIDEVQIYNAALSAAQIQGIYNAGGAGVCP
ncbi:MAG: LamG-like jellyroll fold domain-containing protein, partial [Terracidiphilus sp.]